MFENNQYVGLFVEKVKLELLSVHMYMYLINMLYLFVWK